MIWILKSRARGLALCAVALVCLHLEAAAPLSSEQQQCLARGRRFERHGWIGLHLEGGPKQRGFQHGYLLAAEIDQGLRATRIYWEHESAMPWPWLVEQAERMFTPRIDAEDLAEMEGIVDGVKAAGLSATRGELISYNGFIESLRVLVADRVEEVQGRSAPGPGGAPIVQRLHRHREHDARRQRGPGS